jgi:hypothetical protein
MRWVGIWKDRRGGEGRGGYLFCQAVAICRHHVEAAFHAAQLVVGRQAEFMLRVLRHV